MALYFSGGKSGFFSHAVRISPANRNAASLELAADPGGVGLRRHMAQHLTNAQITDSSLAQFNRHRRLGETKRASDGVRQLLRCDRSCPGALADKR